MGQALSGTRWGAREEAVSAERASRRWIVSASRSATSSLLRRGQLLHPVGRDEMDRVLRAAEGARARRDVIGEDQVAAFGGELLLGIGDQILGLGGEADDDPGPRIAGAGERRQDVGVGGEHDGSSAGPRPS